jgi:hypothetical protein
MVEGKYNFTENDKRFLYKLTKDEKRVDETIKNI